MTPAKKTLSGEAQPADPPETPVDAPPTPVVYNPHEERRAAERAAVDALMPGPGPTSLDTEPLPEGYIRASDLGPGDAILVPIAIVRTTWGPDDSILVESTAGHKHIFAKNQAVRTA